MTEERAIAATSEIIGGLDRKELDSRIRLFVSEIRTMPRSRTLIGLLYQDRKGATRPRRCCCDLKWQASYEVAMIRQHYNPSVFVRIARGRYCSTGISTSSPNTSRWHMESLWTLDFGDVPLIRLKVLLIDIKYFAFNYRLFCELQTGH